MPSSRCTRTEDLTVTGYRKASSMELARVSTAVRQAIV